MSTIKEVLEIANNGNWEHFNGEDRCKKCGKYRWTNKHEEGCPLGILLKLIEKSNWE